MTDSPPLDPTATGLERTRRAVVNVLVGVGLGIAASGVLLRWRDGWAIDRAPESWRRPLLGALIALVVLSQLSKRILSGRDALRDPATRLERFHRGHVASAAVAALAVPLGLVYGWFLRPRLDAVAPFWVAALALGVLAFPRAGELDDFDDPVPSAERPPEPS